MVVIHFRGAMYSRIAQRSKIPSYPSHEYIQILQRPLGQIAYDRLAMMSRQNHLHMNKIGNMF